MGSNDWLDDFICRKVPVQEQEEIKKEKGLGLFDYIRDMSDTKKLLAFDTEVAEGKFPGIPVFMVNKAFANFQDTIYIANELNKYNISDKVAYLFYTYGAPKRKRFAKWYKSDDKKELDIKNLCTYYNWGFKEARENMKLFSREELDHLNTIMKS